MFQLFCRDISCYISVVFKDLKLKLGICNLLKKCMLNIKNHWNRMILKGTFFFAPIKWATSGLVRSAQNWFQSKRYVVKIVRKNSQPKKSISTTLQGCLKEFGVRGQIRKLPLKRSKKHFFRLRVFSYYLDNIPLRLKPVLGR